MNKDAAAMRELLDAGEKEIAEGKGHSLESILKEAAGLLDDQRSSIEETD